MRWGSTHIDGLYSGRCPSLLHAKRHLLPCRPPALLCLDFPGRRILLPLLLSVFVLFPAHLEFGGHERRGYIGSVGVAEDVVVSVVVGVGIGVGMDISAGVKHGIDMIGR